MSRNITAGTTEIKQLVVNGDKPTIIDYFTVKTGQGIIAAGTPLGVESATSKLKKCDADNSDGSQVIFAIAPNDIDTSGGDVKAPLYVEGTFNPDEVEWQGDDTVEVHRINARKAGIYFKRMV